MKKALHIIENFFGIYHWHPKIALRYLPVISEYKKFLSPFTQLLEVGSGGLGIAPYLKQNVIGLDIDFSGPQHPNLIGINGSAAAIPFANKSFEIVITMDMLEHIPPELRKKVILELLRVTKSHLCIGVPTGELSHQQDIQLNKKYIEKFGEAFPFLTEHLSYGLPKRHEIINLLNDCAKEINKKISINMQPNINLSVRLWMMLGWMQKSLLSQLFYRKLLLPFIPILNSFHSEPTYRTLFFVTITQ